MKKCEPGCTCKRHTSRAGTRYRYETVERESVCGHCKKVFTYTAKKTGRVKTSCPECLSSTKLCECGCGKVIKRYAPYLDPGVEKRYYGRHKVITEEVREKHRKSSTGRRHSPETKQKLSEMRRGEKNPNWNPDWSSELYVPYQRAFAKSKRIVWERDESKCQVCGRHKEELNKYGLVVHHIDEDPSNNSVDNLVLVCRADHRRIHAGKVECPKVGVGYEYA